MRSYGIAGATRAQQVNPVAGFLAPMARDAISFQVAAFRKGLGEAGLVDGANLVIEYRWANHHVEQLPALAAELLRRQAGHRSLITSNQMSQTLS